MFEIFNPKTKLIKEWPLYEDRACGLESLLDDVIEQRVDEDLETDVEVLESAWDMCRRDFEDAKDRIANTSWK